MQVKHKMPLSAMLPTHLGGLHLLPGRESRAPGALKAPDMRKHAGALVITLKSAARRRGGQREVHSDTQR
jgi:hypothetical protein